MDGLWDCLARLNGPKESLWMVKVKKLAENSGRYLKCTNEKFKVYIILQFVNKYSEVEQPSVDRQTDIL